ncbi:MAG: hypothetical protein ACRD2N_23055 [Vicinamibacterales bacterium]
MDAQQRSYLIRPDSPLWKLPHGLDPLQASFLDAIRLSVQFIDVAYNRVEDTLTNLKLDSDRALQLGPTALMDAWTIVDAVHRLRALVSGMPRYKNRAPSKRLFLMRTVGVEALRNSFQHLVNDLHERTQSDLPVLGALTWVRPINAKENTLSIETFIPGQFRSIDPSSVVEVPTTVPDRLGHIELWVGVHNVDVSKLRHAVCELVLALQNAAVSPDPAGSPPGPCDAMATITVMLTPSAPHESLDAIPPRAG